jgi:hypothetical protein
MRRTLSPEEFNERVGSTGVIRSLRRNLRPDHDVLDLGEDRLGEQQDEAAGVPGA